MAKLGVTSSTADALILLSSPQVLVPKESELMGKCIDVRITEAGKHFMKAELATESRLRRPENVPPPMEQGQVSGVNQV